jgi:serine/threonine protein kinase
MRCERVNHECLGNHDMIVAFSTSTTSPRFSPCIQVRLVLEYCDKGSLRDALQHHAFMTTAGFNYRGVLDTALDIARAMVHLHSAGIIHGDLKVRRDCSFMALDGHFSDGNHCTQLEQFSQGQGPLDGLIPNLFFPPNQARNAMLKSSGAEGRGVVCKVADFGLAVKIDLNQQTHMSNLFQVSISNLTLGASGPKVWTHEYLSQGKKYTSPSFL